MQRARFMVLTGHLNDYPLSDLIGILRHQRKTGRLLIEYRVNPCAFYFNNGDLLDVQLGTLSGFQAVCVALSQPNASFNFNPLIQPPTSSRALNDSLQKVILELLGCWEEKSLNLAVVPKAAQDAQTSLPSSAPQASALPSLSHEAIAEAREVLALPPMKTRGDALTLVSSTPDITDVHRTQQLLAAGVVVSLLLSVGTIIALTARSAGRDADNSAAKSSVVPVTAEKPLSINEKIVSPASSNMHASESAVVSISVPHSYKDNQNKERRSNRELLKEETGRDTPAKPSRAVVATSLATAATSAPAKASASAALKKQNATVSAPATGSDAQAIKIVMQIESGRVAQASVANRRPGMEAYEALALRIARGRRYPANKAGQETVLIKVNPSKQ